MSDLMRSQFEEWHRSVVDGEPPHEKYSDGSYINPHVNRYCTGWQASREYLVIELPEDFPFTKEPKYQSSRKQTISECRAVIHAVGVKTK